MACPPVTTGNGFLVSTLSHLDCQAQTLGSFGFQALAMPGSPASILLSALLTLFVAFYGIRLLLGPINEPRDLISATLKVAIVLTIAASWPAWRVVAYNTVLNGPAEIAASITPSTLPNPQARFTQRLQTIDTNIAAITAAGTGRQTGQILDQGSVSGFRPIALQDEAGFGWARTIYLASTIGSLAAVRIAGGLLLALAPLMAGLLLFDLTRGIFAGWLRGLALVALGALGLTILLSVQIAIMEPWLADAINRRNLGYATPSTPTELLALVLAFAIATAILLFILTKIAFQNAWAANGPTITRMIDTAWRGSSGASPQTYAAIAVHGRAASISESITASIRREELQAARSETVHRLQMTGPREPIGQQAGSAFAPATQLGNSYRRTSQRDTHARQLRDGRT